MDKKKAIEMALELMKEEIENYEHYGTIKDYWKDFHEAIDILEKEKEK